MVTQGLTTLAPKKNPYIYAGAKRVKEWHLLKLKPLSTIWCLAVRLVGGGLLINLGVSENKGYLILGSLL